MKIFKSKFFCIALLLFFLFNICVLVGLSIKLPETIIINEAETNGRWLPKSYSWFLSAKETKISPSSANSSKKINESLADDYIAKVYLCGVVPVKTIKLSLVGDVYAVPGGEAIGINLKTDGILVVGIAPFETEAGKKISPGREAGIETGDIIKKINGTPLGYASDLIELIAQSGEAIDLEILRDSRLIKKTLIPQRDPKAGTFKLGLWIRESVAGIGTLSFYCNGQFAALGHPISDIDTGEAVKLGGGSVCKASIIGIDAGKKGIPGSLKGVFSSDSRGSLDKNADCGIFGTIDVVPKEPRLKLASKEEVLPGKAKLRCDIGGGKVESFDIEIIKTSPSDTSNKSMIVEIKDKKLLQKTGGIVQGMSGSPIIQNGKLVGALTHVFVNDPAKGYAVFAETMYKEMIR